jgi:conjugative relaxase-like TrwC/TraI family protein
MVASLSAVKGTGAAAAAYLSQVDDYYRGADSAPTAWVGKGAEALGLSGAVDSKAFTNLLAGKIDGQQLGRVGRDGKIEHKPGWDLTFSAPKSVSIMALVADDHRLVDAHETAVRETLAWLEKEAAITRVKERGGETKIEATGNLIAATFRHATSRELQPQMHTHAVIINATRREDGKWRSLESKPVYRLQMEAGQRYRQALAVACAKLGYRVERTQVGKQTGFELADVPKDLLHKFSDRAAQIEAALAARGKTLETATAEEKEIATLDTRKPKQAADHAQLRTSWAAESAGAGLGTTLQSAQAQAIGPAHGREIVAEGSEAAHAAVAEAAAHLSERDARFTAHQLHQEASKLALGKADGTQIEAAIKAAVDAGDLYSRTARGFDHQTGHIVDAPGFATAQAVATEESMLATASRSLGTIGQIYEHPSAAQAWQEKASGFAFNPGQRDALTGILTSEDRVHLVQGYAGTAKTTSVLAAVAAVARAQRIQITALAPTRSAAETLGNAINAQGVTVAKHINSQSRQGGIWIVDEASMISTRDMDKLLRQAEQARARVVMVGDVQQLGSVEAGAAFRQLQSESGLKTHVLDQIVRQSNAEAKAAVEAAINGNAAAAMAHLRAGGGSVCEMATREERISTIASDYSSQTAEGRAESIVIAPGKDDRQLLNEAIREQLKTTGVLHGPTATVETLTTKDLTETHARRAENYVAGEVLKADRDYKKWGVEKGDYLRIVAVDPALNRITAEHAGRQLEINPRTSTGFKALEIESREIMAGDRITFKANDEALGRKNGQQATVVKVDLEAGKALVKTESGAVQSLDLRSLQHAHWSHGYAQTAHEAQGRTCARVFVHAESSRLNLTNQQSLYVAISRAKEQAYVYTDSANALGMAVSERSGQKMQASLTKTEKAAMVL